jgi:hypothetical protein
VRLGVGLGKVIVLCLRDLYNLLDDLRCSVVRPESEITVTPTHLLMLC